MLQSGFALRLVCLSSAAVDSYLDLSIADGDLSVFKPCTDQWITAVIYRSDIVDQRMCVESPTSRIGQTYRVQVAISRSRAYNIHLNKTRRPEDGETT